MIGSMRFRSSNLQAGSSEAEHFPYKEGVEIAKFSPPNTRSFSSGVERLHDTQKAGGAKPSRTISGECLNGCTFTECEVVGSSPTCPIRRAVAQLAERENHSSIWSPGKWSCSSGVERLTHIQKAGGAKPSTTNVSIARLRP
jgi:hypothetical protein